MASIPLSNFTDIIQNALIGAEYKHSSEYQGMRCEVFKGRNNRSIIIDMTNDEIEYNVAIEHLRKLGVDDPADVLNSSGFYP